MIYRVAGNRLLIDAFSKTAKVLVRNRWRSLTLRVVILTNLLNKDIKLHYIFADNVYLKQLVFTLNEFSCCFLRIFLRTRIKMTTTIVTKSSPPVISPARIPLLFTDFPLCWPVTIFLNFPLS